MYNIRTNPLISNIKTPESVAIADEVRKMDNKGYKIAKMQTGEPYFDTPQYIIDGCCEALNKGNTHYSNSQGLPALRDSISKWYYNDYQVDINPGKIIITNGAIHGIYCVLNSLLKRGDKVLIPEPYWPQYRNISILTGAKVKNINTRKNSGKLNESLLKNNIYKNTKLLIINNPSNPTGVIYSKKEINNFLEICVQNNIFVLFDEVYSRIVYSNNFCSVFQCENFNKYKSNIIYVNSFSKTFAMTGWRVGYAIIPRFLIKPVLKVSQHTITNTNTFCQYAAQVAIDKRKKREKVLTSMLGIYKKRHKEILSILKSKQIPYIHPDGAFYFFIKSQSNTKNYAMNLLKEEHIAVVPGSAYGKNFGKYFRISYAVDEFSFTKFVNWIKR